MSNIDDKIANKRFGMMMKRIVSKLELWHLQYYKRSPLQKRGVEQVKRIYKTDAGSILGGLLRGNPTVLFSPGELLNIWIQAGIMKDHGGAFAEVGVYRGASAQMICEAKGGTTLHLFDTFSGLPEVGESDARFEKGLFEAPEADVRDRLAKYPNVKFHPGMFPETGVAVEDQKFSFVHLDVDLYEVTKAALAFFYPRMLPGGRILSHDYAHCEGVWKAFDEFVLDKPEKVQPTEATQVLLIKK